MKNKTIVLSIAIVLTLTLSGCSKETSSSSPVDDPVSANTEEIEETEESTQEETPNEADSTEIEIIEAEVSDVSEEVDLDDTEQELPSTELCVDMAKEIFELTNEERIAEGLPELVWSDELAEAADIRAEEIITVFSHTRPNGEKCYSLGSNIHGENIARGPSATGKEFVEHWMASPGHKENILRKEVFTAIGVGVRHTEMGDTAVQIFGTY